MWVLLCVGYCFKQPDHCRGNNRSFIGDIFADSRHARDSSNVTGVCQVPRLLVWAAQFSEGCLELHHGTVPSKLQPCPGSFFICLKTSSSIIYYVFETKDE